MEKTKESHKILAQLEGQGLISGQIRSRLSLISDGFYFKDRPRVNTDA